MVTSFVDKTAARSASATGGSWCAGYGDAARDVPVPGQQGDQVLGVATVIADVHVGTSAMGCPNMSTPWAAQPTTP